MPHLIPVILGGYVNGYSLARGFYETNNIRSIVIDYKKFRLSRVSSYVKYYISPHPAEDSFLQYLKKVGKELEEHDQKGLLIATNDEWLIPVSKAYESLTPLFKLSMPQWNVIEKLTIKENFYELCDDVQVDYPNTVVQKDRNFKSLDNLKFPVLCKPSEIVSFGNAFPFEKRNNIFKTYEQLCDYVIEKRNKGYEFPFIIQEYIEGGPENLYTATTFSNKEKGVIALSIGRKLTQNPPQAGTITSGLIEWQDSIADSAVKILNRVGYAGMANTEFKYNIKDDKYYAIETNPRPGMWNYSTLLSGVDMYSLFLSEPEGRVGLLTGKSPAIWSIVSKQYILRNLQDERINGYLQRLIAQGKFYNPLKGKNEGLLYSFLLKFAHCMMNLVYWLNEPGRERLLAVVKKLQRIG